LYFANILLRAHLSDLVHPGLVQGLTEMDPAVLVVDDNDHVWQNHRHNLLRVERYMYFPSSMRHFGRSEKSLLERGR
jgi:RNA polymerase II C-terminal domain phosphatase-like 3/4